MEVEDKRSKMVKFVKTKVGSIWEVDRNWRMIEQYELDGDSKLHKHMDQKASRDEAWKDLILEWVDANYPRTCVWWCIGECYGGSITISIRS